MRYKVNLYELTQKKIDEKYHKTFLFEKIVLVKGKNCLKNYLKKNYQENNHLPAN